MKWKKGLNMVKVVNNMKRTRTSILYAVLGGYASSSEDEDDEDEDELDPKKRQMLRAQKFEAKERLRVLGRLKATQEYERQTAKVKPKRSRFSIQMSLMRGDSSDDDD
jgi:hypothetical protein